MSSTDEASTDANWVPVLHLEGETWLGLLDMVLFVGDLSGPKRKVDVTEPIGLLPCLERPYGAVVAELHDREVELSRRPGSLTAQVPLAAIPRIAVRSKNNYWAERALKWISEMSRFEADISTLVDLEQADWATQKIRHHARLLRRDRES